MMGVHDKTDPGPMDVHHKINPEPYTPGPVNPDPYAGILRFRNPQPLPQEHNPQTRAEMALPVSARPMHYGSGMRATLCEVYFPAKETADISRVTCLECRKIYRRTR